MQKVAIIEDNTWLRKSYERTLQTEGYITAGAPDAARAIDSIDDFTPDVILLDMLLTETTGMALLHELQSHDDLAEIPVIVISSIATHLIATDLRPYGVRAILNKETITPAGMIGAIREVLDENASH